MHVGEQIVKEGRTIATPLGKLWMRVREKTKVERYSLASGARGGGARDRQLSNQRVKPTNLDETTVWPVGAVPFLESRGR